MKPLISILLCLVLVLTPTGPGWATAGAQPANSGPRLEDYLSRSYGELFELAPTLTFTREDFRRVETLLDQTRSRCRGRYDDQKDSYDRDLKNAQRRLRRETGRLDDGARHALHCEIQNLTALRNRAELLAEHGVPLAHDNWRAKLRIIEQWPRDLQELQRAIAEGSHHAREHGDVLDIGIRSVGEGQEEDVALGREAIREMRARGILPDPMASEVVQSYVRTVTARLARNSDLRVPAEVQVLDSPEVNAFALPGGFIFVQRGLLEEAENEAELVGVLSHEIAHAVARHGHRLMRRAGWSNLLFQVAQVTALILTGGISSLAAYYAYQYGFQALGLLISLELLGVSRDFELEADQLGVQYAWNAGYDPQGFTRFFDKMAHRRGYVTGLSWFRTHPPFYERMVRTQREIRFLPAKDGLITDSPEFAEMKAELERLGQAAEENEDEARPSLRTPVGGCADPEAIEFDPTQPLETLCQGPR